MLSLEISTRCCYVGNLKSTIDHTTTCIRYNQYYSFTFEYNKYLTNNDKYISIINMNVILLLYIKSIKMCGI